MRHPQVIIYEGDGALARLLRPICQDRKRAWSVREVRQPDACLELLQPDVPAVLVLKLGRNLSREFGLLERIGWLHADTAAVVVADVEDAVLAALAWDLGARYVLMPPEPRERLTELVISLMQAALPGARGVAQNTDALSLASRGEMPHG